jgi:hypothetical protein
LWEKGAGGKRGKGAQGCRKPLITPKNSTFERLKPSAIRGEARLRGLESDFWGSPCVPSLVSGIRTPKLPLLPLWEKGVRGMRGKSVQGCRKPLITPKNSTLERA